MIHLIYIFVILECSDILIVNGKQWQANGFYDGTYIRDGEKNGRPKWTMSTGYFNDFNQETEIIWNTRDTRSLNIAQRYQFAKGWVVKTVRYDSSYYGPNYESEFIRFWSDEEIDCPENAVFHETDGGNRTLAS